MTTEKTKTEETEEIDTQTNISSTEKTEKTEKNVEESNNEENEEENEDNADLIDDSIFITETDLFEISVKYYVSEDKKFIVETIDDELMSLNDFDKFKDSKEIKEILAGSNELEDLSPEQTQKLKDALVKKGAPIFNPNSPKVKELKVKLKYPSQNDHEMIIASCANSKSQVNINDIMLLETTRLVVLIRDWNINADITRLNELDPKLIKAMVTKVREKIGMQSLF